MHASCSPRLFAALLYVGCLDDLQALPPREPEDGSPVPPCADVGIAVGNPKLEVRGLPLLGCTVDITAGASKISLIRDLCHDPTYFDLRPSVPVSWELVSFPTGLSTPSFSANSTLATLSLPRVGTYVVRFTICPSDNCTFTPNPGGQSYPLRTASKDVTIVTVESIPIPAEEYPVLPASAKVATQPTNFADKVCRCQGGGGVVDPQWVTTTDWNSPQDYQELEGQVFKSWISRQDNPLNHHSQDVNFNVTPDPPFRFLLSTEPEFGISTLLGVEWERASFPEVFRPSYGDRVSVFGYWILDCGHEPFYTEIHPPVGIAVHRPRPILLPSDETFEFVVPGGTASSTVGDNVYVPGIITDLWFNRRSGEITDNCSATGLHQPGVCHMCDPPQQNCPPWIGGPCIEGLSPIDRVYDFNIYLPRNPGVNARDQGLNVGNPPLYWSISNPWNHQGPEPVVIPVTEGDVTYLHVTLDLRGFTGTFYSRRIESAWVHPAPDNWDLKRWRVTVPTLDVHDDMDPWSDWPWDDGDWQFWVQLNNGEQEWVRMLDGSENAHGTMNFNPPWVSGDADPILFRALGTLDMLRRLGPDVVSYPDQGVHFGATGFDDDWFVGDDAGQVNRRILSAGTRMFRSSKGKYTIHVDVQPGPAVGEAALTSAALQQYNFFQLSCNSGRPWLPERPYLTDPLEVSGYLTLGIADTPPWSVEPNVAASLGTSVAGVGDVNGDGFDDVLVGGPRFSPGQGAAGLASLYLGWPEELSEAPYWSAVGVGQGNENVFFGQSVAPAGDVDGDGRADFIVGAPSYSNDQADEGAAYVWLGSQLMMGSNASPSSAQWMTEGNQDVALYGWTVASAGDVNGDGYDDVAVAAPFFTNTKPGDIAPSPFGRVFVYLGSSNGLATIAHRQLFPGIFPGSLHWFGYSLASADVNGDDFSDLIIGVPRFTLGQTNEGALFAYMGSSNGLSSSPAWGFQMDKANAQLGWAVASAGDVNGDGYEDVLAGAPQYFSDDVLIEEGAAFLFLGSSNGLGLNFSWARSGGQPGAHFGTSLAGVGDLDGDGLDDVVVGAPDFSGNMSAQGRVSVYRGYAAEGLHPNPIWTTTGPRPVARFGASVAAAGDVDDDGFSDFIVGAPSYENGQDIEGAVFLYRGCGPREIRPAESRFFRSVGPEKFALFSLVETNFPDLLAESDQNDPAKLNAMLAEIREELLGEIMGTPLESDAMILLEELRQYIPPDIWQAQLGDIELATSAAIFLDCGATNETVDAHGRRWKPDAPFLVSPSSNVNPFNGEAVDISLLSDATLPNEVILSERWRDGDLLYQIPVNNTLHTVILYFSENCSACVNPDLGGTGPTGTARLLDIEVEGQMIAGYNPADAALPPADDGLGETFKATEVIFRDVTVNDGFLSVGILDRGSGNPPENASIKAMAILQQAAPGGLVPPRIASIRPVENFFEITVDPGANLAAYYSGLAGFDLEESTDFETWTSTGLSVSVVNNRLLFQPTPANSTRFYRVVSAPANP